MESNYQEICEQVIFDVENRERHLFFNMADTLQYIESDDGIDLSQVDPTNWQEHMSNITSHRHSIVSIQARFEELFAIISREITSIESTLFKEHKDCLPSKPTKEDKLHLSLNYLSRLHTKRNAYEDHLRMTAKKKEQYEDKHWGLQSLMKLWELRARIQ